MGEITKEEILGNYRIVQPRAVPHGYQVEQWEKHRMVFDAAKANDPKLDFDSFMVGWNKAFSIIYKS